jgi:hypothetical protein
VLLFFPFIVDFSAGNLLLHIRVRVPTRDAKARVSAQIERIMLLMFKKASLEI